MTMNLELNRQELSILIGWKEEATKGKFSFGDGASALTWEEQNLISKIEKAAADSNAKDRK